MINDECSTRLIAYLDSGVVVVDLREGGECLVNVELVALFTVLLAVLPVEGDGVVLGQALLVFFAGGGKLGEVVEAGNVQTRVQLWLVIGQLRLHQLDGGGEETGQKGKVGNVEDGDFH